MKSPDDPLKWTPPELSRDKFLDGALEVFQPRDGYRAATDPVFLAASVAAKPGQAVLELGCGAGVALACLGRRVGGLSLCGVEVQRDYAALARHNFRVNALLVEVVTGDIEHLPSSLRGRSFDHVIANPPYLRAADGTAARNPGKERAFREQTPLAVWLEVATRRLRPGGILTFIQRADRLAEVLAGLDGRVGSLEVKPLAARHGCAAGRVIVRARKGGRGAMKLHAPLILHDGAQHDGDKDSHSPAARDILRHGRALLF